MLARKPLRKPRRIRSSVSVQSALLDHLEKAPYLTTHEVFLAPCGQEKVAQGWEEIRTHMLTQHGQNRSAQQWKQAWRDLKSNCRRRAADKKDSAALSGDPDACVLTPIEERVLRLCGEEAAFGLSPLPLGDSKPLEPTALVDVKVEPADQDGSYDCDYGTDAEPLMKKPRRFVGYSLANEDSLLEESVDQPGPVGNVSQQLVSALATQSIAIERLTCAIERQTQILEGLSQTLNSWIASNKS